MSVTLVVYRKGEPHRVLIDAEDQERIDTAGPWHIDSVGYLRRYIPRREGRRGMLRLHRFLLGLAPENAATVDHRNGDTLDNRKANLRATTKRVNQANRTWVSKQTTSRFRGVFWNTKRRTWQARAQWEGHQYHVGYFHDEVEAATAVREWWAREHPDVAVQ